MANGVDALSTTWMILTQARWLTLRSKMTMRQLARWCDGFTRWLPKSSVRIVPPNPEEDLCQMIFIKVFQKLSQFSGKVPLEHWVSRIAVNTCLNQIESEKCARTSARRFERRGESRSGSFGSPSGELAPDHRFASANWSNIFSARSNRWSGWRSIYYICRDVRLKRFARSLAGARRLSKCGHFEREKK